MLSHTDIANTSTEENRPKGASGVNFGLAAGFGLTALLVFLLLIALALVMYQRYYERKEAAAKYVNGMTLDT